MRARILVVDDNEDYLWGIKELLKGARYEPIVAGSFQEGRRVLQNDAPDLMILDVRIGAFNGLELICRAPSRIPVIIVSGFDDPVLRAQAAALGASYVVKPVEPLALLTLIEHTLISADATAADHVNRPRQLEGTSSA